MKKQKHIEKIRKFIKETPVFNSKDIERITQNKNYGHLILSKLAKKGEIFRITKNFYSIYNDPIFSVFCFKPAYLGLYEALSLRNIWEQETNVIILTSRKVRTGVRKIFDSNVIIKHIKPKYYFGFDLVKYESFYLPASDLEKTFIDLIYFKEPITKDLLKIFKRKMNFKKLKNYLKNYPHFFLKNVLNKIK